MKRTKEKNFERELPQCYEEVQHINAKRTKFGVIFNLIALAVLAVVMAVTFISLLLGGKLTASEFDIDIVEMIVACVVLFVVMIAYIVLHELVHGIAYKVLTEEKLTFGISWSCAFCGVPHIYVYRKTAIISAVSPLAVFTVLLIPILVVLYIFSPLYYLIVAFIFGLHIGGCNGDIYTLILLLFKYKNERMLMRDTGPEQFFYIPKAKDVEIVVENREL